MQAVEGVVNEALGLEMGFVKLRNVVLLLTSEGDVVADFWAVPGVHLDEIFKREFGRPSTSARTADLDAEGLCSLSSTVLGQLDVPRRSFHPDHFFSHGPFVRRLLARGNLHRRWPLQNLLFSSRGRGEDAIIPRKIHARLAWHALLLEKKLTVGTRATLSIKIGR